MKKWILTITIMLCLASFLHAASGEQSRTEPNQPADAPVVSVVEPNVPSFPNGITASLLFADSSDLEGSGNNIYGRLGYQYGILEVFLGEEVRDFDIFEFGFKLYSRDVTEQQSVPILSDFLSAYFNEETMEIRGYTGAHWLDNRQIDSDYTGAILGIEQKEKGSPLSLNAEVQYNNSESNKVVGFLGVKWGF